jgi:uncharacterized protein YidB (DUF937 family)
MNRGFPSMTALVGSGPNRSIAPSQVEQAMGSLSQQTGFSREEILAAFVTRTTHPGDRIGHP